MRIRLIISFTLIVLVSVISVVLIARQGTAREVRMFMFRGGMTGSDGLVGTLEDYYRTYQSWQGVDSLLSLSGHGQGQGNMMGGGMMRQRIRLADSAGNLVADTSTAQPTGRLNTAELQQSLPLVVDQHTVGYLLPEGGMGYNRNAETYLVQRLSNAALTAGLVAGGISLLLALLLAYQLLRPVRELTHAARHLGEGDLAQRVRIKGNDELAILGQTFNRMADSLQQAEESRKAMTADIAHELRNPLAVQRANLEALQDGIYPLTKENLQPILDQNLLLSRLVDDLRTLALADAGQLNLERAPINYPGLIQGVIERYKPQAESRHISLEFQAAASTQNFPLLFVDAQRIEQVLGNLLSNALRHTPEKGRIVLELSQSMSNLTPIHDQVTAAILSIHDSGPGIAPESLPRLFERFYRADRSRSRAEGGSGLGLAIARQIAEAHQGSLVAANHPQGGAVFTLTLPILSRP